MTLEDGLTADSLSAAAGEDYTFRATDPLHYDYKPSAKVGGKDVTVTCSYSSWQQEPFNGREVAIGILDNQKQLAKIKAGPQ